MTSVLFTGCSIVAGDGLDLGKNDPGLFCNLLTNKLFGTEVAVKNIAVPANSNERIFLDTASELSTNTYDYVFVGWTALHRLVFWPGLETYECRRTLGPNSGTPEEHNGNDLSWSSKDFEQVRKFFLLLNHSHYAIQDLVIYVNTLCQLAKSKNTKIYFINCLLPWDREYFTHILGTVTPSMLTKYTNELLNSSNRDDEVINQLYHKMQLDYQSKGGIQIEHWLNLYQSFNSMTIDVGNDGKHPGYQSQIKFTDFLIEQVKQNK